MFFILVMKSIFNFISRWMAVLVLCTALLALFVPSSFAWLKPSYINFLLGLVMFGMGLTINLEEFKIVFMRPKDIIIGCLAQFTIMPFFAFLLTKVFNLPAELAIGVILVGACPGGTASNVITYLAGGDLALSVGMTGVSTLFAPVLTPVITWLLAGKLVDVSVMDMMLSIIQVVILPIILGLIIKKMFPKFTEKVSVGLPAFSTIIIMLIVGIVVSVNSAKLMSVGLIVILVVALHNICGLTLGYAVGKFLKLKYEKCTAISIEVGMQNSGLACSLATQHFAALQAATVPGAIFSVWHNISGAIVAKIYASHLSRS